MHEDDAGSSVSVAEVGNRVLRAMYSMLISTSSEEG